MAKRKHLMLLGQGMRLAFRARDRDQLKFRPTPPDSYVPVRGVELALKTAMVHDICGVHMLAMPQTTGKTTSALKIATDLLDARRVAGVVVVDAAASADQTTFSGKIEQALHVHAGQLGTAFSYAAWFNNLWFNNLWLADDKKPTATEVKKTVNTIITTDHSKKRPIVVILDNVDHSHLKDSFRVDLLSLAGNSVKTQDFIVVMLLREPKTATIINEWNGRTKIYLARTGTVELRSTPAEVEEAVRSQCLQLNEDVQAEFLHLALRAESVGFVAAAASQIRALAEVDEPIVSAESLRRKFQSDADDYHDKWRTLTATVESSSPKVTATSPL